VFKAGLAYLFWGASYQIDDVFLLFVCFVLTAVKHLPIIVQCFFPFVCFASTAVKHSDARVEECYTYKALIIINIIIIPLNYLLNDDYLMIVLIINSSNQ